MFQCCIQFLIKYEVPLAVDIKKTQSLQILLSEKTQINLRNNYSIKTSVRLLVKKKNQSSHNFPQKDNNER